MTSRQAVAAYVQAHLGSHRAIAQALGVSASTVDRACRAMRQALRLECPHGRAVTHQADARRVASPDRDATASRGASGGPGGDAPWRAPVMSLRPRVPEPDAPAPDAPASVAPNAVSGDTPNVVSAPADQHGETGLIKPRCPGCHYRQLVAVPVAKITHCEQCGHGWRVPEEEQ